MNISILQENLSYALAMVARVVSPRVTLPVLGNLLMVAENGQLQFTATDLEVTITCRVAAQVHVPGAVTVPARTFAELAQTLSDNHIDLALEESTLTLGITSGASQAQIKCIAATEFPPVQPPEGEGLLLPAADWKEAIQQVAFAASSDESRPILTGVLVERNGQPDQLNLVAADGFRLSRRRLTVPANDSTSFKVIIPARALRELARVLRGDEQLSLQVTNSQVIFRWPGMALTSQTLDGQFPDYEQIIPQGYQTRTTVLTADLAQACKQAGIFAREGSSVVRLEISPADEQGGSRITIRGVSEETGSNQTLVQAGVQGEPLQAGYNVRFLQEALGAIKSPTTILETSSPTSPGVIRPAEGDDYLQIVMSMHLGGE